MNVVRGRAGARSARRRADFGPLRGCRPSERSKSVRQRSNSWCRCGRS